MAGSRDSKTLRRLRIAVFAGAAAAFFWIFPPFHIAPLSTSAALTQNRVPGPLAGRATAVFDPRATAARLWEKDIPSAARQAADAGEVAAALQKDATYAKTKYAKAAGLDTRYFLVHGVGKVAARDRNYLRVALEGSSPALVSIRIGPVFGNTVRDGLGILDVNTYPGLQEFNDLAAQLNALVERKVQPLLREKAIVGATVRFVGCAEATEGTGDANPTLLAIVPVQAEVR